MRKILNLLMIIMLISTLTACSLTITNSKQLSIQKAELSLEEQAILDLVGSQVNSYILDFVVDNTVQSLQINTYELQNKEWKLISGGCRKFKDSKGKIALTFDNIGLGLRTAVQSKSEKGSSSYQTESKFNFEGLSTATSYLTDKTIIGYEKEIPLVIQIHTSKNGIASYSPEYGFYEPQRYEDMGYEKIYAVTCMFSQKSVNELDSLFE